jgi:hypothetical protein
MNKDNIYWSIGYDEEMGDVIVMVTPIKFVHKGVTYVVPEGFCSDGMSIPRMFWRVLSPKLDFKTLVPSVVHDWNYSTGLISRKEADDLYYDMLVANGGSKKEKSAALAALQKEQAEAQEAQHEMEKVAAQVAGTLQGINAQIKALASAVQKAENRLAQNQADAPEG